MPADFSSQLIVIAGAGRKGQLGEALAIAFARQGATLALIDRTQQHADERAADIVAAGYTASAHAADLADHYSIAATVEAIHTMHPSFNRSVRAVICAAGGFAGGAPVDETPLDQWERMITVNLQTAFHTTCAFLPSVRNAKGSFVYFTSVAALAGGNPKGFAAYAAAKSGVLSLMRTVAADERKNEVRANAIAPTSIRTASNEKSMGADRDYVERESVADVALFLTSQEARNVSGQVITLA